MTRSTSESTTETTSERRHVLVALRLAVVGARIRLLTEVGIIAALLLFTIAIAAMQGPDDNGRGNIAVVMIVYISAFTAYLQTMTQTFPFALSLGITRRNFAAAVGLLVAGEAVLTGVALTVLLGMERWTGGWGFGLRFFEFTELSQPGVVSQVLAFTAPVLVLAVLGVLMASVFKRWGAFGVWSVVIGAGVLGAVTVLLVTWQEAWPVLGRAVESSSRLALTAGYPTVLAVVLGAAAFLVVRRATP